MYMASTQPKRRFARRTVQLPLPHLYPYPHFPSTLHLSDIKNQENLEYWRVFATGGGRDHVTL